VLPLDFTPYCGSSALLGFAPFALPVVFLVFNFFSARTALLMIHALSK
jgi:hypothetical protein